MLNCKLCNRQFKNKRGLSIHNLQAHTETYKNVKEKLVKSVTGFKHTEETKKKISESRVKYLQNNPEKVPYLLNHSSEPSNPEKVLIKALKESNITGWEFQYQNGIYQYDFAFPSLKLDIEIDGETHNQPKVMKIDRIRDEWSNSNGWEVIRFKTKDVRENLDLVVQVIKDKIHNNFDIYEQKCEVDYAFLKDELKKIDLKDKARKIDDTINQLINSNINFSKYGWVNEASKIINITPQKVNDWMRRNMYDFWNEKTFKRNK